MFNNVALDIVIGLVFIYLLYSLLASIIQEIIATQLAFRSKILEKAVLRMLEDGKSTTGVPYLDRLRGFWQMIFRVNRLRNKKFASRFYGHPLMKYLAEDNWFSKPAYIDRSNFSKIIIDLLNGVDTNGVPPDIEKIRESVRNGMLRLDPVSTDTANPAIEAFRENRQDTREKDINADTQLFLRSVLAEAGNDLAAFRSQLEKWFDETMERATDWYKRYVQVILFGIGMFLAVAFNVDSISIAQKLARDPKLREQLVQNAQTYLEHNQQLGARIQSMKEKGDTGAAYRLQLVSFEQGRQRTDSLLGEAKNFVDKDIKNINNVIGLGYNCQHPALLHIFFFWLPDASLANFIGWLITALAISLGAPFWFDLLSKLMRVKGAAKKEPAANTASPTPAPVTVTVNTQPGEEAVG
ncbi:hypothetical protein [Sediminibacterium soli]|uniref:hypothetical protein n=1 Tax=Sediminibacterium soli TaxID=2698829 RepID=UPI00137A23BC|nr:hypothetical protein [Sediminibacterium soli]NCI46099.1 hypothetical protein [Sediminibacterium soli]